MNEYYKNLANKSAVISRVATILANDKELYDYTIAEEKSALLWGMLIGATLGLITGFVLAAK